MSKVLNYNTNDTSTGVSPSITISPLNFPVDFRTGDRSSKNTSSELFLKDIKSPVALPETIRVAYSVKPNVYANSILDKSLYAPSKQGWQVLSQLDTTWSVTDSDDPTLEIALPMHAHLVISGPMNDLIDADAVMTHLIGRLLGTLFETGSITSSRLESLMRGALIPTGM